MGIPINLLLLLLFAHKLMRSQIGTNAFNYQLIEQKDHLPSVPSNLTITMSCFYNSNNTILFFSVSNELFSVSVRSLKQAIVSNTVLLIYIYLQTEQF